MCIKYIYIHFVRHLRVILIDFISIITSGVANTIDFLSLGSGNIPLYFGDQTTKHIVFPSTFWGNWQNMPIFPHKYKNKQTFLQSSCKFVDDIATCNALLSCDILIRFGTEARQWTLVYKKRPFCDLHVCWLPLQRPLGDRQMNAKCFKSTNPESSLKIRPIVVENSLLLGRPRKIFKNKKKIGKNIARRMN